MAVTFSTSSYFACLSPHNVSAGVRVSVQAFSFSGTNPTYTFQAPVANVLWAQCAGTPPSLYDGTNADRFVINNSRGTSGFLTSLSSTTNSANPVISITRLGTAGQDASVLLLSQG